MGDYNPCILLCRFPIVVILDFSRCFLIRFSVKPSQVFTEPYLITLIRTAVFGMNSATRKFLASSGFKFCSRILFTKFSDCCCPRGTFCIPVILLMVPSIISSPLFWMEIYCLSSVMVHTSSHKTPNDINEDVCIFGKMWIYLAILLRPGS